MPCLAGIAAGNGNEERRLGGAELGRDARCKLCYKLQSRQQQSRADTGSTQELRSTTSSSVRR